MFNIDFRGKPKSVQLSYGTPWEDSLHVIRHDTTIKLNHVCDIKDENKSTDVQQWELKDGNELTIVPKPKKKRSEKDKNIDMLQQLYNEDVKVPSYPILYEAICYQTDNDIKVSFSLNTENTIGKDKVKMNGAKISDTRVDIDFKIILNKDRLLFYPSYCTVTDNPMEAIKLGDSINKAITKQIFGKKYRIPTYGIHGSPDKRITVAFYSIVLYASKNINFIINKNISKIDYEGEEYY